MIKCLKTYSWHSNDGNHVRICVHFVAKSQTIYVPHSKCNCVIIFSAFSIEETAQALWNDLNTLKYSNLSHIVFGICILLSDLLYSHIPQSKMQWLATTIPTSATFSSYLASKQCEYSVWNAIGHRYVCLNCTDSQPNE